MQNLHRLPVELWHEVFDLLPNTDLKSFASTSHYLRALTAPKLFTTICVRFGRFADRSTFDEESGMQSWDEEREEEEVGKSLDALLNMVESDIESGRLVLRDLVQILRVVVVDARHMLVFEKYHLRLAMKRLIKLRHFSWIGDRLPLDIAEELSASCPGLQSLCVHGLESETALALQSMSSLRDLELIDVCASSASHPGISDGHPHTALGDILDRNRYFLRKLALSGSTIQNNSLRLLDVAACLTHLAINDVHDLPDLILFLRQASVLESLTVLDVTSLAFLPCNADALPKLRDFKLGIDHLPNSDSMLGLASTRPDMRNLAQSLLAFVRLHTNVRRFDLSLWPTRQYVDMDEADEELGMVEENMGWFSDVMEAVCVLDGVQALGVSFPALGEYGLLEALVKLGDDARSIRTCTALRLGGVSDAAVETAIGELRRCTFLALSNNRPREHVVPKYPIPSIEELVFHYGLSELEQVCLGGQMYDVGQLMNRYEEGINAEAWRFERLRKRTEADFCSPDAHWLMSYRTISKEYEVADADGDNINMEGIDDVWAF